MERVEGVLQERLLERGMKTSSMPAFIRNVLNSIEEQPLLSLDELNTRLQSLGWDNVKLDSYTFQLIETGYGRDLNSEAQLFNHAWQIPDQVNKGKGSHRNYRRHVTT
jgi:hypothetical protein